MKIDKENMGELIKIYGFNTVAFLSAFTTIDTVLKIVLSLATLAYTVAKIIVIVKEHFKNNK